MGQAPDAMFAEVYRRPDDRHLRHVVGDMLQEQGDLRGEFIALQLARELTSEPATAREKELLTAHSTAWLGRLAGLVFAWQFARGFVFKVQVRGQTAWPTGVEHWPEWSTIGELDCRRLEDHVQARLVGSPAFASLRTVSGVSVGNIARITRTLGPLPWRSLAVPGQFVLPELFKCPLPALTSLAFFDPQQVDEFGKLMRSPLGRQLEHVTLKLQSQHELQAMLGLAMSGSLKTFKCIARGGELNLNVAAKTYRASDELYEVHGLAAVKLKRLTQ